MLAGIVRRAVQHEAQKRWSLLSHALAITLAPRTFARDVIAAKPAPLRDASRYLLLSIGTVLLLETAFSFAFDTAFSDLIHHAFPVLVAATGGLAIYMILKVLLTRNVLFSHVLAGSFYVGGTALLVMVGFILCVLTGDFAANYQSVMTSGCAPRTIMCLISGNTQSDYGLMQDVATRETQGGSFAIVILTILVCLVIYSAILAAVFKELMTIARWRTLLAAAVSVIVLSPGYIILINVIYRWFYGPA